MTSFAVQDPRFVGQIISDRVVGSTANAIADVMTKAMDTPIIIIADLNPCLPSSRHEFINLFVRVMALTMPGIVAIISIAKATRFFFLLFIDTPPCFILKFFNRICQN
ncbi:MAG: hypothetical protein KAI26_02080 [Nanoarchaeota archaeon]|nr:hypothetical protein [Nanoarchaeota archaeon]